MSEFFKSTLLFLSLPSFRRGAARIVDLRGDLDSHKLAPDADYAALKDDWAHVGQAIHESIDIYEQQRSRTQRAKREA